MAEGTQRRLTVIVSADVVGYSCLMGRDEAGTLRCLNEHRADHIDPPIAKYGGRIVKTTGDGLLLEFPSVVAAVECVVTVQEGMAARNADIKDDEAIRFRIGLHLDDVIVEGDDIFGYGVNIAARLQEIGEAGGVTISSNAHDSVYGRIEAGFVDDGDKELKNIERKIRVWRWRPEGMLMPANTDNAANKAKSSAEFSLKALIDSLQQPTLAVLPFVNMSRDETLDFFCDGLTEGLITDLSRASRLSVAARNSSFKYKGQTVDIQDAALKLGVRYLIEGRVQAMGARIRVNAQLIDSATGA